MSEQNNIADALKNALSGDALKNALTYASFIEVNGITLDTVWRGGYVFHYKGECICLIGIPPFWDVSEWNIYGFDNNTVHNNVPVDEDLKEFAWAHVKPCAASIGGECGGDCKPGISAKVFDKDFGGTCCHVMKFECPDAEAIENIIKLTQVWMQSIDTKKAADKL